MAVRAHRLAVLIAAVGLSVPSLASADTTLGNVLPPSGSAAVPCLAPPPNTLFIATDQSEFEPAYTVPAGGPFALTKWSINTDGVHAGDQATMVITKFVTSPSPGFQVLTVDNETLEAGSLPSGNVETFTLPTPIPVDSGDLLGLYVPGASAPGYACGWKNGSVPPLDATLGLPLASSPTPGQTLPPGGGGGFQGLLNVGATLAPRSYDSGLSLSSGPSNAIVGQPAVLTATVTNNGPLSGPMSFTDPVPAGVNVVTATADSGSCATSSLNIVTCNLSGVPAGHSGKVVMVVTPSAAGSFSNAATVADSNGGTDPNPANNSASTTLKVVASNGPSECVVPKLSRSSVALAKKILPLLGCTVGKTTKSHSKTVATGLLIGTSPGAGSYAVNKTIVLKVSSGPPPKKHKKK